MCVFSDCTTDRRLRDPEAYCTSLHLGPDYRLSYNITSHVLFDRLHKTKTSTMSAYTSVVGWFEGKETADRDTELGQRAERVCFCLFVFIHVAYCSLLE